MPATAAPKPHAPRKAARLEQLFREKVVPAAMQQFGFENPHELPKLEKIVVNCGVGRFLENQKLKPELRDTVIATLSSITGQKPVMILAKKSVSNFKVREGAPSAFMVTLRGQRMWSFLDRLIHLAIPRIKDFRGVPDNSFDKGGNYAMGLSEQAVWPEINMASVQFSHGMNINIVFANSDPERSKFVLRELGMPFVRPEEKSR
ncbi:MAG: 50S ribosomal protein L5 [Phycisphaerales bacterium]